MKQLHAKMATFPQERAQKHKLTQMHQLARKNRGIKTIKTNRQNSVEGRGRASAKIPAGRPTNSTDRKHKTLSADLNMLRRAKDAQRRLAALAVANLRLEKEIRRRYVVEAALKESERHQRQSLKKAEQMQGQLRDLSRAILDAQEEERRRISRELHDDVLQSLVGINVHLENLSRAAQLNVEQLPPKIILAQRLIAESVNSIHRFARELRPLILDDLGLLPALESYLTEFSKQTGIRVRFSAFAEVEQLSSTRRTVLYRVVQSALTNIVKHGNARQVKVSIENGKTILLKIHDNGRSFDVANILHTKSYKRLGLLGMRERVEMIGGNFSITSLPGKGTTICAEIPMMASEQKKPRRKTSIPLI